MHAQILEFVHASDINSYTLECIYVHACSMYINTRVQTGVKESFASLVQERSEVRGGGENNEALKAGA